MPGVFIQLGQDGVTNSLSSMGVTLTDGGFAAAPAGEGTCFGLGSAEGTSTASGATKIDCTNLLATFTTTSRFTTATPF